VRVLSLEVPEQELIDRIRSRGQGRADDTEETVRRRLEVFRNETAPVLGHYAAGLSRIDGVGAQGEIAARIAAALGLEA
jgi:adenylate kinase